MTPEDRTCTTVVLEAHHHPHCRHIAPAQSRPPHRTPSPHTPSSQTHAHTLRHHHLGPPESCSLPPPSRPVAPTRGKPINPYFPHPHIPQLARRQAGRPAMMKIQGGWAHVATPLPAPPAGRPVACCCPAGPLSSSLSRPCSRQRQGSHHQPQAVGCCRLRPRRYNCRKRMGPSPRAMAGTDTDTGSRAHDSGGGSCGAGEAREARGYQPVAALHVTRCK